MEKFKISDIAVFDRKWGEESLLILKEGDHLLRRFGQIKLMDIDAGINSEETINEIEDEIWTLISGYGLLRLTDVREGSPSANESVDIILNAQEPKTVLVPFGIKYSFQAEQNSEIIIVRTHQEDE